MASVRVTLRVHGLGGRLASSVVEAVKPDDSTAPDWLKIVERIDGDDLVLLVEVSGASRVRLGGLRNTVDELLAYIYGLLRSLEEAAKALKELEAGGAPRERSNEPEAG